MDYVKDTRSTKKTTLMVLVKTKCSVIPLVLSWFHSILESVYQ